MRLTSDHVVYAAVGGAYAVILVLLFLMGPLGWIAGLALLAVPLVVLARSGLFKGEPSEPKVSCSNCGARNAAENDACSYCEQPLAA